MIVLEGRVVEGRKDFCTRITKYPEAFRRATGQTIVQGTVNVDVRRQIPIKEHFRIRGTEIDEAPQDLLFEVCRINGIWAYRIRPYNLQTGGGGWGDHVLEICCSQVIPNVETGTPVQIVLLRDDIVP